MRLGALVSLARFALPLSAVVACGGASATPQQETELTHVDGPAQTPRTKGSHISLYETVPTTPAFEIDLGTVRQGDAVRFDVPNGTLGFNVVVEGDGLVGIDTLRSPTGEIVAQDYRPIGGMYASSLGATGIAAASVPQNMLESAKPPTPGTWEVAFTGSSLHAKVRAQVTPGSAFPGGVLDVHVYLPTGLSMRRPTALHPVSAASAPVDEAMQVRLDAFFDGLETLFGIRRGHVVFHDIDERFINISNMDQLQELYTQSAAVPDGQALHVMLVKSLLVAPGHPLMGRAAAIPGPAMRNGTSLSGIAVTILNESTPETDALVLLHEAGHFFGLNHTSELAGGFDPLPDTPECQDISLGALPDCPDVHNLMFPSASWSGLQVSPGQRAVVQGSPNYRLVKTNVPSPITSFRQSLRFEQGLARGRGDIFGHDGELSRVESVLFASMCGHSPLGDDDALRRALGSSARVELTAIADSPTASGVVKTVARRALARY